MQPYLYFLDTETGYQWKWGKEGVIVTEIPARKVFREVTGSSPGVNSFVQQDLAKKWAPVGFGRLSTNPFDVQNCLIKTSPVHMNQPPHRTESSVPVSHLLNLSEKLKQDHTNNVSCCSGYHEDDR